MYIRKLKIHNFRNITHKEFSFTSKINVFYGDNGVGKTSILEAIHFTSSGKSFRKSTNKSLINVNEKSLTVFIEGKENDNNHSISVNKNIQGKWKAKINNKLIKKQSDITLLLPVISIDPEVYRLVDFGPLHRRNYLDWLVFHVKHDYIILWKKVYRCVKQLNMLYKNNAPDNEINVWELNFVNFSEELNKIRYSFFNKVLPKIIDFSTHIQPEINSLSLSFKQGWPNNTVLSEQLKIDRKKNRQYGQLQHGPHKMDIEIKMGKLHAAQTLSRGQKKALSISFYMAYVELLLAEKIKPILCLDDLDAELDVDKLSKVSRFFIDTDTQIFITSVHQEKIEKAFPSSMLFHVKQ